MADVSGKISTPQRAECESGSSVAARFAQFCKSDLELEEGNFMEEATKLFDDNMNLMLTSLGAIGAATLDEAERYWFVFTLYSVRRLSESIGSKEKGLSLCRILRSARLNIVDFHRELHQYLLKVGPTLSNLYGAEWEKRLEAKESQANFVHLTVLSKKYQCAFQELFVAVDSENEKDSTYRANSYLFGWLLFLALREQVFCMCKDLVTCTHGLVSVLAVLFIHVPAQFRNLSLVDSERIVKNGEMIDLLASLCNMYETSEDVLHDTFVKVNNLIAQLLEQKPCLASECKFNIVDKIVKDGLVHFDDLMDESSLSTTIDLLDKNYEALTHNKGEFDERIFLNEKDSLLASGCLSGGAVHINGNGAKRKLDLISSPTKTGTSPLSPFRSPSGHLNNVAGVNGMSKSIATPVSTAINTAKWLRTVVSPLPSKPSAELERFLVSCDRDVTADVMKRAQIILKAIFPSSGPGQNPCFMDNIWAEQRRLEAMKLYFRVLQAMCIAESQILHAANLTSLLTNERFHRCMLACSSELVLATHKTVTLLFPTVLEKTGITAFDLSKVIESFIRHEESLPRELRRHLNSLEERLLDSMVWEKGSSMYNSLVIARPTLSAEITRLGLLAEPMPSLDAIAVHIDKSCGVSQPVQSTVKQERFGLNGDMRSPKRVCTEYRSALVERNSFTSPVKERFLALNNNLKSKFPQLQSAFASPSRPHPGGGGETCAETTINVFFSKILKLAAVRINGLVERLQLSQQIKEFVYGLFQKILVQRTNLFFCRHIDQIILCSLYGIAKISQLNLTFKEIIFNYRKQPHCKQQVFRNVYVEQRKAKSGPDHVDIITFYNEMFIPSVKPLLAEFASDASAQATPQGSKAKSSIDSPLPASPRTSPFPNLPDMSPKKVSAAHNVYVSPLRSSKMDALISHSTKSYYACVGESTRAYQSPSKDLSAINTHLNGNRKLRGSLNFDDAEAGLVTDSVVANSLYVPNGSAGPVKSEVTES